MKTLPTENTDGPDGDGRQKAQDAHPTVEDFRKLTAALFRSVMKNRIPKTRLDECLIAASPKDLRDLAEMGLPTEHTENTKGMKR